MNQVREKAEVIAEQLILTRQWVADMRGVFVLRRKGIEPNPFLSHPVLSCNGINLVLRNPALVTRELSEYSKKSDLYFFKITSDKVINPANSPDEIEKKALKLFREKGLHQFTSIETIGEKKYYRFIKPLKIKNSCLTCHVYQGYKIGDLRGCLSVSIPINCVIKDLSRMKKYFLFASVFIILFTSFFMFLINYFITIKPINHLKKSILKFRDEMDLSLPPLNKNDEIGELERNFYELAAKVKNNHEIMIKEIEKATEELKKKDKMKTDFIATISHELRTPLTTIQGGIEYLFKVIKKKDNIEFLEIIDKNIKTVILMVNNLIDIARIEIGKLELNLKEENIKELINEILIFFKGYALEKNIKLFTENLFDCFLNIDKNRINQVFINVLHNAIKFSPENESIYISMDKQDNKLVISIVNKTTSEIKREEISKLFIKYKYLSNNKERGSGLGLAIAKGIMQAHKGDININLLADNKIELRLIFPIENA